jgi:hypothetical protein
MNSGTVTKIVDRCRHPVTMAGSVRRTHPVIVPNLSEDAAAIAIPTQRLSSDFQNRAPVSDWIMATHSAITKEDTSRIV